MIRDNQQLSMFHINIVKVLTNSQMVDRSQLSHKLVMLVERQDLNRLLKQVRQENHKDHKERLAEALATLVMIMIRLWQSNKGSSKTPNLEYNNKKRALTLLEVLYS
jgi:hypothetical protein